MKDFIFLFRGGLDFTKAPAEQVQGMLLKWKGWVDQLKADGIYIGGERLVRNEGVVVRGRNRTVTEGAYTANGELVGGYISIRADNLQQAIDIAQNCPIFIFDGNVEVREVANM